MKPTLQRRLRAGDGDCYEACLASILEVPIGMVPDYHAICDEHEPGWCARARIAYAAGDEPIDYPDGAWPDYLARRRAWLSSIGLAQLEVDLDGADEPQMSTESWWHYVGEVGPDFLWIATTRVHPRFCHATVWRGDRPEWNPYPGNELDTTILGELVTATWLVVVDVSRTRLLHAVAA